MDVLSDVLRMVRMEGALFVNAELREPWCIDAPDSSNLARVLQPGAGPLAICHLVLEGTCWITLHGGEPIALERGDVAVLPHGNSHVIGSNLQHQPVSVDHVVQLRIPELERVRYGGDGDRSVIVCGWLSWERDLANPLVASLPALFRASLANRPSGPWIEQSIGYALSEAASGRAGGNVMASRIAEMLFVEALRSYAESLPPSGTGWLAGLRDPQIGKCIALMHGDPARAWTVDTLAGEVHMSRSVLAERFTELAGQAPMQYLKRWRLATAARSLRDDRHKLQRIAAQVGYESEAAFSRAFKREYGASPGSWRRSAAV
jgi:AraC-like DNA-binding protein